MKIESARSGKSWDEIDSHSNEVCSVPMLNCLTMKCLTDR